MTGPMRESGPSRASSSCVGYAEQASPKQLLGAGLRHAHEHGAKLVEAYPVEADSPSYRHMGFVSMFEEAGFHEVGREGTRRHVMQRKLRARAK